MEFLSKAWEGISSAFSNIASSVGNFFSGFGGGGGFGGGATSSPVYTPSPTVGTPLPPAGSTATPGFAPPVYGPQHSQGITYPQDVTNIHRTGSVQGQGLNILGEGARRVADSIGGIGGRVFSTIAAGSIAVAGAGMGQDTKIAAAQEREAMWRANSQGAISMAPHGQPMGQMPNARGQFGAVAAPVPLSERLIQAKQDGAAAMMGRALGNAQTDLATYAVGKLLPKASGPGGFFFGNRR